MLLLFDIFHGNISASKAFELQDTIQALTTGWKRHLHLTERGNFEF